MEKEQAIKVHTVEVCVGGQWHVINREYAEELRDTLIRLLPTPKSLNHDYELKSRHEERSRLAAELNAAKAELAYLRQFEQRKAPLVPTCGVAGNVLPLGELRTRLEEHRAKQQAQETGTAPSPNGRDGW